jgi:hypothetical protein
VFQSDSNPKITGCITWISVLLRRIRTSLVSFHHRHYCIMVSLLLSFLPSTNNIVSLKNVHGHLVNKYQKIIVLNIIISKILPFHISCYHSILLHILPHWHSNTFHSLVGVPAQIPRHTCSSVDIANQELFAGTKCADPHRAVERASSTL